MILEAQNWRSISFIILSNYKDLEHENDLALDFAFSSGQLGLGDQKGYPLASISNFVFCTLLYIYYIRIRKRLNGERTRLRGNFPVA